jgi:hypothetical protein
MNKEEFIKEELNDELLREEKEEPFREWKSLNLEELQKEYCEDVAEDEFNAFCKSRFEMLED